MPDLISDLIDSHFIRKIASSVRITDVNLLSQIGVNFLELNQLRLTKLQLAFE